MEIFISYRYTGENEKELDVILGKVCSSLNSAGHVNHCTFWDNKMFDEKNFSDKLIFEHAFKQIDSSDIFLAFVKSEHISQGMLVETGYAIAKNKKVILFINKNVKEHILRRLFPDKIVEFKDFEELYTKLTKFEF